ncbi:hypothetical protein O0I10_002881 [Lichtheimia ornata]|uniref:Uncharacterized protein n=1 Tax=Lichtheimia ornata TaxID=688661 RepID=A0AAD7V7Z6_9FUNG|nr:uncharacterized protein O0I10_002881 [Lichtheimia ornata]KAJ8661134.1 hypothetical protein O0I10_002881 [Lichtheimia ornata]
MEEQTWIDNAGKGIGSYDLPMEGNLSDNLWHKDRRQNLILSFVKRHVTIPPVSGHLAAAAQVLMAMLSLKQKATINCVRFAAMLEKQWIEIEMLCDEHDYLREDSVERSFESMDDSMGQ